jgi:phytoene dehydrogenase-like protein
MGANLNETQQQEVISVLEKWSSYSYEDLKGMTAVPLEKWIEENVKDELVRLILGTGNGVTDIPAKDICLAQSAWTMGNMFKGKSIFITFKGGSSMDTLVRPLEKVARSHGVEIRTNTMVKEIV